MGGHEDVGLIHGGVVSELRDYFQMLIVELLHLGGVHECLPNVVSVHLVVEVVLGLGVV